MFQGSFRSVSTKFQECFFQECFKEISGKFQECFKKVSRVFQLRLKGVSSSFKGLSRVCERSLKTASGKFEQCVKEVFCEVLDSPAKLQRELQTIDFLISLTTAAGLQWFVFTINVQYYFNDLSKS